MRAEAITTAPRLEAPLPLVAEGIPLRGGRMLRLRPVEPADEAALVEMAARSTAEDRRFRFHGPVLPHMGLLSSRLANVDPARHIALAAYDPDSPRGDREILSVVRLVRREDGRTAELAVMVRSDWKGRGLGFGLIREILQRAEGLGLSAVEGEVLPDNKPMLRLVRRLGGHILPSNGYFGVVRVQFDLSSADKDLAILWH
jgi:acetyltransferase